MTMPEKPLGIRAYGSIPHLPGSRRGPADKGLSDRQSAILTSKARDRHDLIIVQEKLDGSCVSVANIDGRIVPLIRAGYEAASSNYEQHRVFAAWAFERYATFEDLLQPGERIVGEWLAQAHGTRYALTHDPFVVFDLMIGHERATWERLVDRVGNQLPVAASVHSGGPLPADAAMELMATSRHGALDPVEGAVWRCERKGVVDFLGKYVRDGKVDGCYLPEISNRPAVWNWRPQAT